MSPKGSPRGHKFTMVMTDDERRMLDEVSQADSRSAADWLRIAIKRAHDERFAKKKTPKKRGWGDEDDFRW